MEADVKVPEPLQRRPEARAFKVEDLLAEVKHGKVRIPPFQRPLRWEPKDARELLDSLYRGYPVGTLLFWETKADPGEMRFGTFTISAGASRDALWVVDGQQRIVSLARILLAPDPDQDHFALYFDLDERKFIPPPSIAKRADDEGRWLPLTEVLDSQRLLQWLFSKKSNNQYRVDGAIQLGRSIREYDIPVYLVRADHEDTLREVFGRINSSGKPLKASDVFDALHGARSGVEPTTLPQIVHELESLGFGRVEEKLLYGLLRVLQGVDVSERSRGVGPPRLTAQQAEAAYRETMETVARVIQFLKTDVGIPHYALLPYKQPMVILGTFFHYHPTPRPRSKELLVRWIWRGAITGAHRGDTVSTREVLACIDPENEERSIQGLIKKAARVSLSQPDPLDPFNFRFASSKLLSLALLSLQPRHLRTGEPIVVAPYLDMGESYFPFRPIIYGNHTGFLTSVSNRIVHPRIPNLKRTLLDSKEPTILASHGVSSEAVAALREGDIERFILLRSDYLKAYLRTFFESRTRWEEPDRPSIDSLIDEAED